MRVKFPYFNKEFTLIGWGGVVRPFVENSTNLFILFLKPCLSSMTPVPGLSGGPQVDWSV